MSDRSRSPRGAVVPSEADLRAALAAAEAALAAERARAAAERAWAADLRSRWLSVLHSTFRDAHELAVLAHRAGASDDLIDYWYAAPPPPPPSAEPEAEPDPQ
jgi:hypothetical protein